MKPALIAGALLGGAIFFACDTFATDSIVIARKKFPKVQYGVASYYHDKFQNRLTASGEKFDQKKMTAAHNGLPLNTWIRVTNLSNKRSVIVRVNDRLHRRNTRLVDLSNTAAKNLGYLGNGLTQVKVEVFGKKKPPELVASKSL
ncbi:MAG: septal ring lytic transglycosylase RlpA family protein [Chitinophagaceae bacterium]|nr:septal ring lytic transglycosylase RlpA family protein [Chitinophagaceae bacterium]